MPRQIAYTGLLLVLCLPLGAGCARHESADQAERPAQIPQGVQRIQDDPKIPPSVKQAMSQRLNGQPYPGAAMPPSGPNNPH